MIIDIQSLYRRIIYVLVKRNFNIKLRKDEKESIIYDDSSLEDGYNKIVQLLIKKKRIRKNTLIHRIWYKATSLWRK